LQHENNGNREQDPREFRRRPGYAAAGAEKGEYIDTNMRRAARKYTARLSGDCEACRKAADALGKLSSPEAREALYKSEIEELVQQHALMACL
jgi:hypothetical protein